MHQEIKMEQMEAQEVEDNNTMGLHLEALEDQVILLHQIRLKVILEVMEDLAQVQIQEHQEVVVELQLREKVDLVVMEVQVHQMQLQEQIQHTLAVVEVEQKV